MSEQGRDHPRLNLLAIIAACLFGAVVGIIGMKSFMASEWMNEPASELVVPFEAASESRD
jgi:hypothetical protein